jgi:hypothetical protein
LVLLHSEKGKSVPFKEITAHLKKDTRLDRSGFDFRKWLDVGSDKTAEGREGDNLEYGVAAMLLRLGPQQVYRGNALAVRREPLPRQAMEFAQSRRPRVEVILKDELEKRLRSLLSSKG